MKWEVAIFLTFFALFLSGCKVRVLKSDQSRPNIILILADDLGYGDLGCYGQQKIETPNLDSLAVTGMKFTQFYAGSPVCAPSRCVLMTGKHSGHAYIRGNDEWSERGNVWSYEAMIIDSTLEGQRPLPEGTVLIPSLLKKAGYRTAMIGKWGLGAPHTNSIPTKMGFDFFCGYNCQRQAHTYFPVHLYLNENRILLGNDTIAPGTKLEKNSDPWDPTSYENFKLQQYAPETMFRKMVSFIEDNKKDPLFIYWATPIPHVPLQAPDSIIQYYVEKFGNENPYTGDAGYFPQRYPHAAYAAMISYLDMQIGKLIKKLKEEGLFENTVILFTSDNGPTYNGGTDSKWFSSTGPFHSERGWAKGSVHEGGIRVPLIVSWPFKVERGSVSDHMAAFQDVMPTLCEFSGANLPENNDGISFLPVLLGQLNQKDHPYLYWEFPEYGGQQAVRMDRWKAIRKNIKEGSLEIELYDLEEDLKEENNIASQNPEILKQVKEIMKEEHEQAEIFRFRMSALGDSVK